MALKRVWGKETQPYFDDKWQRVGKNPVLCVGLIAVESSKRITAMHSSMITFVNLENVLKIRCHDTAYKASLVVNKLGFI